ncbi:hypothetical protein [Kosakonia oryzae]|uniref:Uncharacterized protein n=1 Tax=Kosakonia oryzae TaxID=497725 RepID=A0ABX7PXW9_9ENTR|nr:hypothetical protein [Kosakonia oryzae]QSV12333.1 hypothetical protein AWR26_25125 [Kosakonia oryzae]
MDNCRQPVYPASRQIPNKTQSLFVKKFLSLLFAHYQLNKDVILMRYPSQIVILLHHNPTLVALAKCRIFTCVLSLLHVKRQFYQPHPKKKPFFRFWQAFCNMEGSPEP